MRYLRRSMSVWVISLAASALMASVAAAYSPGTATARKPTYSADTGGFSWGCSFSGWRSGARVQWSCKLFAISVCTIGAPCPKTPVQSHSGAWTPPPSLFSTPNYYKPMDVGQAAFCVEAYALSVDGGVTNRRCNF